MIGSHITQVQTIFGALFEADDVARDGSVFDRLVSDGDDFVISGQKVFISNGQMCDLIVLATKTDASAGAKGVTLFLVDTRLPGFRRGKNLHKLGLKGAVTGLPPLLLQCGANGGSCLACFDLPCRR